VRADQDATGCEDTRVGQTGKNASRGRIGRARPSRAELSCQPCHAGNVRREGGALTSEPHHQAIQRG